MVTREQQRERQVILAAVAKAVAQESAAVEARCERAIRAMSGRIEALEAKLEALEEAANRRHAAAARRASGRGAAKNPALSSLPAAAE